MSIQAHYTKKFDLKRMADTTNGKQELSNVTADVPCHLQPLDDSFSEDIDGGFGKDFLLFTDYRDVRQGDRMIIDSNEYRVMSIEKYDFLHKVRHVEARVRLFKN